MTRQARPTPCLALIRLCQATMDQLANRELRTKIGDVRRRLAAPLQVAVAGSVSCGKSTLVNALLGQPVAPVDAGECTRVVTCYEYGDDDGKVEIELDRGTTYECRLDDAGRLPLRLPVPAERVGRIRVLLRRDTLKDVTVIDTPGVNTVAVENERAARRLLFGSDGGDHVQAMVYVLRHVQRFDATTLADFRTLSSACGMSGVNTLAVLSQVDRCGDEDDPWPTARRLSIRAYERLRTSVFDVVPVIGLLAETGRACLLTVAELDGLRELARLDQIDLDDLLVDINEFGTSEVFPLPVRVRERLVARLHRYGILTATRLLRVRPNLDLDELHTELTSISGFASDFGTDIGGSPGGATGSVLAGVNHFARRADQLKALAAITELRTLDRLPAGHADRAVLARVAEALDENRPIAEGLHGLRVFAAVEAACRKQLNLDERMLAELLRLSRYETPASRLGLPPGASSRETREAARSASARWRTYASTAGNRVAVQRARDVLSVLEELAAEATGDSDAVDEVDAPPPLGERPAMPIDMGALDLLEGSQLVPETDRQALRSLREGTTVAGQLGQPDDADDLDVARLAAAAAGRFRGMSQRPMPRRQREAVLAVCDVYERIWSAAERGGRT